MNDNADDIILRQDTIKSLDDIILRQDAIKSLNDIILRQDAVIGLLLKTVNDLQDKVTALKPKRGRPAKKRGPGRPRKSVK